MYRTCKTLLMDQATARTDPIGDLQRHLVVFSKSLADALYAIEHAATHPDAAALRASLHLAANELDRLVAAVPDYGAAVGPRDALVGRLRAGEEARAALAASLAAGVASAEERLAASTGVLQRALEAATGSSASGRGGDGGASSGSAMVE
jgi:hypothetical protein